MATITTETLRCIFGEGHDWEREIKRGVKPSFCPAHRLGGRTSESKPLPTPEEIIVKSEEPIRQDVMRHFAFERAMTYVRARLHTLLVGPAASGKSTFAEQAAEILSAEEGVEIEVYENPCSDMMTVDDLVGYVGVDATTYRRTALRDAFEFGGVFLLDELDNANGGVLVAINTITALGVGKTFRFPDGKRVARHRNFVIVAGANTWGRGADGKYNARQALDESTLSRFAPVAWEYDERLERIIAANLGQSDWAEYVIAARHAAAVAAPEMEITPRATINGAAALNTGARLSWVREDFIWNGWTADTVRAVKAEMRKASATA